MPDNFVDDNFADDSRHAKQDNLQHRAVRMDLVVALDTVANKCFDRLAAVQALASIGVENLALEFCKMKLASKKRLAL